MLLKYYQLIDLSFYIKVNLLFYITINHFNSYKIKLFILNKINDSIIKN